MVVAIMYVKGFYGEADIAAYMDDWYQQPGVRALSGEMVDGKIVVSNAIDAMPETTVTVNGFGSIK